MPLGFIIQQFNGNIPRWINPTFSWFKIPWLFYFRPSKNVKKYVQRINLLWTELIEIRINQLPISATRGVSYKTILGKLPWYFHLTFSRIKIPCSSIPCYSKNLLFKRLNTMVILIALKDNIAIIYNCFTVILSYNTERQDYHEMPLNYYGKFFHYIGSWWQHGSKTCFETFTWWKIA